MSPLNRLAIFFTFICFSLLVGVCPVLSGEMELPPYQGSQALESMKKLEGTWKGTHAMGGKEEPVTVEYKVSSNGSTILETLFPGSKHEMTTVYHDKNGNLSMTHYCSIGNQPHMDVVKADNHTLEFALSETSNIDVTKDRHMHGLTMTMMDDNHLVHNWAMYHDGKEGGQTILKLERAQ